MQIVYELSLKCFEIIVFLKYHKVLLPFILYSWYGSLLLISLNELQISKIDVWNFSSILQMLVTQTKLQKEQSLLFWVLYRIIQV